MLIKENRRIFIWCKLHLRWTSKIYTIKILTLTYMSVHLHSSSYKNIYLVSYFIAYFIYIRICMLLHTHMVKCYYSFLFCTFLVLFHSRQNTCNLHKPYTKVWYVDHYISFCKKYIYERENKERTREDCITVGNWKYWVALCIWILLIRDTT